MSIEHCGHCGDPAPVALLRNVQLRVDGDAVDEQTLCPDCFADWIARYQEEMAAEMPGSDVPETTGGDIRIAEEDESVHSHQFDDHSDDRLRESVGGSGDEIRDLATGMDEGSDDGEVNLDGEAAVGPDGEAGEDDDGGLF